MSNTNASRAFRYTNGLYPINRSLYRVYRATTNYNQALRSDPPRYLMVTLPTWDLEELLDQMGEAGFRLTEIDSCEGAAGNLSICVDLSLRLEEKFPVVKEIPLPQPAPELAGRTLIVSGSGCRLRDIFAKPMANLACIVPDDRGGRARMFASGEGRFERVTSEFNSHLAVHLDRIRTKPTVFHAVVHAQPLHLTYLSHIPRYQDETFLNLHLFRWQPETILNLPQGIGVLPFLLPGSDDLTAGSVESLRRHQMIVWGKHGVVARSDSSILRAVDLVEYAETAARYEYLDLSSGEIGEGLSPEELLAICRANNVIQDIF